MAAPLSSDASRIRARDLGRLAVVLLGAVGALRLAGWQLHALVTPWSDLRAYFLPKYQWAADRIASGELPLWNPLEFGGLPFLATIQPGVFYPPIRIAYAILDGVQAYDVLLALHVLLAAAATLVLARRLGLGSWPSVFAATWVVQPVWLIQIYDHPVFVWGVAWIPVLLLLVRRAILRPGTRAAALLGVGAALQVMSGYPPYVLATGYVLALAVPLWFVEARPRRPGRLLGAATATIVGALIVATLVAAAQLVPTIELLAETNRAAESQAMQARLGALSPGVTSLFNFPQATLGASLAELWARYGPVPLGLAALALVLGARRPATWWALGTMVFCTVLPRPWYQVLPLYDLVRLGQEWRFTAPFTMYVLAAVGLDAVVRALRLRDRWIGPTTLGLLAAAMAWNWAGVPAYWLARAHFSAPPVPAWAAQACPVDPHVDRAYWLGGQPKAALFRAGIRSAGGYEQSLLPARAARVGLALGVGNGATINRWDRRLAESQPLASRAGLRCVLAQAGPALRGTAFERVAAQDRAVLYENRRALPRARIVHETLPAASAEDALAQVAGAPADAVVLEGAPRPAPAVCRGRPVSGVQIRRDAPEDVVLAVTTSCAGWVVLADTWYPGWTATVDGAPVQIRRADYAYRAVAVTAGRHEVRFRYAPRSVPVGIGLSAIGLLLVAAFAWWGGPGGRQWA